MVTEAGNGACGDSKKIKLSHFSDLKEFEFKEVLGGDSSRKSLFLLVTHREKLDHGILICDKLAFVEEEAVISAWLSEAELEHLVTNDIYGNYVLNLPAKFNGVKSTFIYPVTEKHIVKYRREEPIAVYETAEDFKQITEPHLKEFGIQWVYNVLEGKSEAERVIYHEKNDETGFLLAPDLKWNGTDVETMYLQAIVHRRDLGCVRNLTKEHLPLLRNIRDRCCEIIKEKYNLKKHQLKLYVHYLPTYYHFHVHIISLKYDAPASGMTSIPLDEIISNIENFDDYYQKVTMMFIKKKTDGIVEKFVAAGKLEL